MGCYQPPCRNVRINAVKQYILTGLFLLVGASFAVGQTPLSKTNYTVYEIRGDIKAPRPILTAVPSPPDSLPTNKHLKVRISLVVAPDGSVANVKLLTRSTAEFDNYAVNAVSKWKFEPATKDGIPVAVRLETEMQSQFRSPASAPLSFASPDGGFNAVVLASGKEKGSEQAESRVEIHDRKGTVLCVHDFSSPDGEHGYGADTVQWTPDSEFFVFRMRNSGGHMPMYAPLVFWSRSRNHFYQLDDYTADQTFSVTSSSKIVVDTWPDLKPATVSLWNLGLAHK